MVSEQMTQIIERQIALREERPVELAHRRRRMQVGAERMPAPAHVSVEHVDVDGVPCEWIRPAAIVDERVVLYFHGGGYAVGGLDTHRKMIGFLASATGLAALSVGYRLAPEHPYPAALDDCIRVLSWLVASGVAATDIVVAGDSAGGGLAVATCIAARDNGWPMAGALVLLSPWLDMAVGESSIAEAFDDPIVSRASLRELRDWYVGDADAPLASPLWADLAGLPPTLIHVGQRELLSADAVRFGDRLRASGVDARCEVWDGMVHVWHFFAGYAPEADAALASIAEWLHGGKPTER
jgi:epsilon-lactone hydrolase